LKLGQGGKKDLMRRAVEAALAWRRA
jgi:hypothetical protein